MSTSCQQVVELNYFWRLRKPKLIVGLSLRRRPKMWKKVYYYYYYYKCEDCCDAVTVNCLEGYE